jgi:hypothetical protein
VVVYAVVDDALAPDFPLGDSWRCSSGARTQSASSRRSEATIPTSRATCGSRSAS